MSVEKVYYLGPEGSFSHRASLRLFDEEQLHPCRNFDEVFERLDSEPHGVAMVPLENSTAGAVDPALDLLIASDAKILAESHLPVAHCLLGKGASHEGVDTLYAMNQPYYQSRKFVLDQLREAKWIPCESSSDSMERCLQHGEGSACIGHGPSGRAKGLEVLASDIQDCADNHTRFVLLSSSLLEPRVEAKPQRLRSSVVFTLEDRPGALLAILEVFRRGDLNMRHIESRPSKDSRWRHNFLVTLEGDLDRREDLESALREVSSQTPWSRILGTYPLLGGP